MIQSHNRAPTIPLIGLIALSFFWVSGGIYGNEEMMLVAAPAYVLPMLLIAPILYGVPIMLLTAELSGPLPMEGGPVSWVYEASRVTWQRKAS